MAGHFAGVQVQDNLFRRHGVDKEAFDDKVEMLQPLGKRGQAWTTRSNVGELGRVREAIWYSRSNFCRQIKDF